MKSCNDHFRGRETLKHPVNLPRFLSLHFPFRARNGGGKRISCGFSPVVHVVVYKHSESPKSFYLFRSQRKPSNCDVSKEKCVHTMQWDCFHHLNSFLHYSPVLILTQLARQSLLMGSKWNVFKIMC